jgi:hypothetical protein
VGFEKWYHLAYFGVVQRKPRLHQPNTKTAMAASYFPKKLISYFD